MTSASIICSTPSSGRASSIAGKCQSTNTDTLECSVSVASKTCLAGRSRQKTSPIARRMTKIASPDRTGCDTGSALGCQNNQLSPIKALPVASPRRGHYHRPTRNNAWARGSRKLPGRCPCCADNHVVAFFQSSAALPPSGETDLLGPASAWIRSGVLVEAGLCCRF